MKNYTKIILAMSIISASNLKAQSHNDDNQTDFRTKLIIGAKVGGNKSNVFDAQGSTFNADAKFGLAFGAFAVIPIGKTIGIQPEVIFSQKGFKANATILNTNYSFTRTTNYIDVPILFALNISEFITLHAGPQYSYLMKQRDEFGTNSSSIITSTDFSNSNMRKNVLCVLVGFDINIKHIVLGGRAGWDVQNNNGNGTTTNPRYKNVWYQATVGYRFYTNN